MIQLQPMTDADYARLMPGLRESYAEVVARNLAISLEAARARADRQIGGVLKDGLHTEGHYRVTGTSMQKSLPAAGNRPSG